MYTRRKSFSDTHYYVFFSEEFYFSHDPIHLISPLSSLFLFPCPYLEKKEIQCTNSWTGTKDKLPNRDLRRFIDYCVPTGHPSLYRRLEVNGKFIFQLYSYFNICWTYKFSHLSKYWIRTLRFDEGSMLLGLTVRSGFPVV